jgi:hypothetical protein
MWEDGFQFDYDPENDCLDLELKIAVHGLAKASYPYTRKTPEQLKEYFHVEAICPGWMKKNIWTKSVFFWRAQLRHYGLPTAQKKEVCKERIQEALRAGTLQVPDHLLRLESKLKEQFLTEPRFESKRRYERERKESKQKREQERKETYLRLHPPPVPKGTFSYDPDDECLSVAVQKDSHFGTSVEKREDFQRLVFYLHNDDHPAAVEKSLVYWKAQLIHHGIRSTQPKARCKKQLLDAAQAGSLRVPQHLVELEAMLKAEYEEKRVAEMTPAERALHEQRMASTSIAQEAENPTRDMSLGSASDNLYDALSSPDHSMNTVDAEDVREGSIDPRPIVKTENQSETSIHGVPNRPYFRASVLDDIPINGGSTTITSGQIRRAPQSAETRGSNDSRSPNSGNVGEEHYQKRAKRVHYVENAERETGKVPQLPLLEISRRRILTTIDRIAPTQSYD